ncbi:alpha/beta fold hydrolase [Streptomyces sp. NPDC049881]|uniref:alpha/beta hydrolase n=1 Tax=Streptomyces sp. NPDC049881 TaxID=3155778 RepID=UPI00341AF3C2
MKGPITMARARRPLLAAAAALLSLTQVLATESRHAWAAPARQAVGTPSDPPPAHQTSPQAAQQGSPTAPSPAALPADVVDIPVSFTVRNVNRSRSVCAVDGGTYTVRGHLTAPRALLGSGDDLSVTLYQHDIASGEWFWRLDAQGHHLARELAARGHASLTVDRLGYGASDIPNGTGLCLGGSADIAHQITQQLRDGDYRTHGADRETPPAFDQVFLAGQGNGAQLAQIAGYSFDGIDGLVLMDWTDVGLDPRVNAPFFTALGPCLSGADNGYAYYDPTPAAFAEENFTDVPPEVLGLAVPLRSPHPCGEMVSQPTAVLSDLRHLPGIDTPVLLLFGEHDPRVGDPREQRELFTGADTELVTVPGAGHYVTFGRRADVLHDALADWLTRHGG